MVPAGQPLAIGEVIGNRTPTLGRWQYSYQPLASSTTVNGQPQSSGSFVPQAGRDYTVRYTNVLKREPAPPDPPKLVTRFPCLEISKSGCPGSPAQFQVKARGGLARVYGTQTFNMLANGGPHRFCPTRDELEGTPDPVPGLNQHPRAQCPSWFHHRRLSSRPAPQCLGCTAGIRPAEREFERHGWAAG